MRDLPLLLEGVVMMVNPWILCLSFSVMALSVLADRQALGAQFWTYIGTYTRGESQGIYVARFDAEQGRFDDARLAAATEDPSFLAIHPQQSFLYAVGETAEFENQATGFVRAFRIDPLTGLLERLNSQRSAGVGPCHLIVDAAGTTVLVANYGSGTVASLRLSPEGFLADVVSTHQHPGSSVNPQRQEHAHAHSIQLDRNNRFAFSADLGADKVFGYRFVAESGELSLQDAPSPVQLEPGSGPRHFAFHPNGQTAYLINELASTIAVFHYDSEAGRLDLKQTVRTLPDDFHESSTTAEVVVHPSGRLVFGSNRGHDSIAVFQVSPDDGTLTTLHFVATGGRTPRNFAVDPSGNFLLVANQDSHSVVVFRIDLESGQLTATDSKLAVPSPVCLRFLPAP